MQISSRTEDFLIDTFAVRDDLHILNNVFTNPNVVKVSPDRSLRRISPIISIAQGSARR